MATLLESIESLEPRLVAALDSIRISLRDGQPLAELSFNLRMEGHGGTHDIGEYSATVDLADLPEGVSVMHWRRWPNRIIELTEAVPAEEQMRGLWRAGICGELDIIRGQYLESGEIYWLAKTHAEGWPK